MNCPPANVSAPSKLLEKTQLMNGLNAARVVATVLVVLIHACVPYLTSSVLKVWQLLWLVHDTARHVSIDAVLLATTGFVMPLFFLLAGMSAASACANSSFRDFTRHRFVRLLGPAAVAAVLLIPLLVIGWGFALLWTERIPMSTLFSGHFPKPLRSHVFGPGHLWFLEYLTVISVGWCAATHLGRSIPFLARLLPTDPVHAALNSPWRPLIFAVPTAVLFAIDPDTPYRFTNSFIPDVLRLAYYTLFFAAGIRLATLPRPLPILRSYAKSYLVLAAVIFCGLLPLWLQYLDHGLSGWALRTLNVLQALFAWCMVFGFLGAAVTWGTERRDWVTYLNEASFWIYLMHVPVLGVFHFLLWPLSIPVWGKLVLSTVAALVATVAAYHGCVRYSLLGSLINGARRPSPTTQGWRLEAGWLGGVAVTAAVAGGLLWVGRDAILGRNLHAVVEGRIYRSNRLSANDLDAVVKQLAVRSVLSIAPGDPNVAWRKDQVRVCASYGIPWHGLDFHEDRVPTTDDLEQLRIALAELPRPILIQGHRRSPTLAGIGSAVALLLEGRDLDESLRQFDLRYFQLEGAEHCIVAKPLVLYRQWLAENGLDHSVESYRHWALHVHVSPSAQLAEKQRQPVWQALMGAPRYPRRF